MKTVLKLTCLATATVALAGCAEDGGGSGQSGITDEFTLMASPCIEEAAVISGESQSSISAGEHILTSRGPILILNVAGESYRCRLEDDGTVTVSSEFAT